MKRESMNPIWRGVVFLSGIILLALGFNMLLLSNSIIVGGLPGVSLLLNLQYGIEPAVSQWALGIPIFVLGYFCLGKKATLHSLAGAILLPLFIFLTKDLPPVKVETPLLAALFGGFVCGIGLGLVFQANATVGGFSILARMASQQFGIPLARTMLLIDGVIVVSAGVMFGAESAMLALVSVVSLSKAIDVVQSGLGSAKSVTIITDKKEQIRDMLVGHLDCGATIIKAEGAYRDEQRTLIVTVIPRAKVARLRRNVKRIDPSAFTIISDASEVMGYGFQHHG